MNATLGGDPSFRVIRMGGDLWIWTDRDELVRLPFDRAALLIDQLMLVASQ